MQRRLVWLEMSGRSFWGFGIVSGPQSQVGLNLPAFAIKEPVIAPLAKRPKNKIPAPKAATSFHQTPEPAKWPQVQGRRGPSPSRVKLVGEDPAYQVLAFGLIIKGKRIGAGVPPAGNRSAELFSRRRAGYSVFVIF